MIDIVKIASSTDKYNFHSHTQFCDGRVPMAEMAAAAVGEGFLHWGFSPHSPIPIPSPCNMRREDTAAYFSEIERLREKYAGRIELYAGMEIDYLGFFMGACRRIFQGTSAGTIVSLGSFYSGRGEFRGCRRAVPNRS